MPRAVNHTKPYAKLQIKPSGTAIAAATMKSRVRHCQSTPVVLDTGGKDPSPVAIFGFPPSLLRAAVDASCLVPATEKARRMRGLARKVLARSFVPLPYARFN